MVDTMDAEVVETRPHATPANSGYRRSTRYGET